MAPDERLLAEIPNVSVKNKSFRLYLTNRRLVLAGDSSAMPPVIIQLGIIRNIAAADSFSDDPVINLSLETPGGSMKKMSLVFTQEFSGVRDKERDQLKQILQGVVSECRMTVRSAGAFGQGQRFDSMGPIPGMAGFGMPGQMNGYGGFGQQVPGGFGMQGQQGFGMNAGMPGQMNGMGGQPPAPCAVPGALISAANINVKSQEYTASLTSDKLILVNPNQPQKPSTIPLCAVRSAESENTDNGEPAVGLLVESANGTPRRMVLVFSQWYNKNRFGERETWVHAIQDYIADGRITQLYTPTPEECAPSGGFSAKPPQDNFGMAGSQSGRGSKCPECGREIAPGAKFCGFCGYQTGGSASASRKGIIDSEEEDDFFPSSRSAAKAAPKGRKEQKRRSSYDDDDDFYPQRRERMSGPMFDENSPIGRLIKFIREPADAFQCVRGQDIIDVLPVLLISIIIYVLGTSILLSIFAGGLSPSEYPELSTFADFGTSLVFAIEFTIVSMIAMIVMGVLLHLSVSFILGYNSDLNDGLRISGYSAISIVAGIIPVIGMIIAPIWAFVLQMLGVRETFNVGTGQALLAAAVPGLVFLIAFYIFMSTGSDGFEILGSA